jgi:SAM-dependent methyltransferase
MKNVLEELLYFGRGRFCPVCGKSSRRFRQYGAVPREDAQCVHCGALERHRLLWLFIQRKTDFFDGMSKKMLHVAPEACFEPRFKEQLGDNYLTADLFNPRAMVKLDITDIQYADQSFDVIYCSHVLEHVQDDRRAMREFFRVLKNNGWAILLVPVTSEHTFEDPSILEPEERLRVFGQEDHVRRYGPDYADRLREAGFNVEIAEICDLANGKEAVEMGLTPASGEIYFCTK